MDDDFVEKSSPKRSHVRPTSSVLEQKVAESSPTDRVERLLRKYKSRQFVRKTSVDKVSRQLLNEEESWKALIVELDSHIPYHSGMRNVVITAPHTTEAACQDCLHLDIQSSIALRGAVTTLLHQLSKKDFTGHQDVLSTFRTTRPHATQATPTKKQHPITLQRMDHVTSVTELGVDPLVERLHSQVTRLEYENAKLKVDLQNNPSLTTEDEGYGLVMNSFVGYGGAAGGGGTGKLTTRGRRPQLSALEMAGLLRHWLLDKGHLKHASVQSVLAMIRHFQQLFDVPHLDGVYAAMSRLYQQSEQSKNIFKQLKSSLQLDPSCSNRELISSVEYLCSHQSSQLLLQIEREFGPLEVSEVMEKLRLCDEFFPAFHAMVTELQEFLGVSRIGDITSAVYNLS